MLFCRPSGNPCYHLAAQALPVYLPFSGQDQVCAGQTEIKVCQIQNSLDARLQLGVEKGVHTSARPVSRAAARQSGNVCTKLFCYFFAQMPQALIQTDDGFPIRTLLRGENISRPRLPEGGTVHVAHGGDRELAEKRIQARTVDTVDLGEGIPGGDKTPAVLVPKDHSCGSGGPAAAVVGSAASKPQNNLLHTVLCCGKQQLAHAVSGSFSRVQPVLSQRKPGACRQFHHGGLPSWQNAVAGLHGLSENSMYLDVLLFAAKSTKKAVYAALSSVGYGNTDELCIGEMRL